jgi:lantibiotic biosynthesis protein
MFKIKNHLKEWYQPHDSFVVRNPLLPIDVFFNWNAEQGIDTTASKQVLRRSLREFFLEPVTQEALYIASPVMHERLMRWLDDKIDNPEKKEKTELSLIKYMTRMSSRCTPYGLFASCTSGIISGETSIQLCDKADLLPWGRLDMDYLCELHAQFLKQKSICNQLRFYPNSSLYRCGYDWRLIESRLKKTTGRSYHLVEMGYSFHLEKILVSAGSGKSPEELAAIIMDHEISSADAIEFIYELIDSQVLVDELNPAVTGDDYFTVLLHKLKTLLHTEEYVERLEKLAVLIRQIRVNDGFRKNTIYARIAEKLPELESGFEPRSLLQVDSFRPASLCTLNAKVNDEILKGISLLQLLSGSASIPDAFNDFKIAFNKRYNEEWIPLVEVLDTEWGIGYGKFKPGAMEESPLIDSLPIGHAAVDSHPMKSPDTESFKWQLYQEAIKKNMNEITIDDNVIEQLSKKEMNADGLPDSFSALVKIYAVTPANIDKGNYTISIDSLAGPSGGNLLGRFCHLDPAIEKLTRTILEDEEAQQPDCIFAEIVHLPEARTGNILMRPVLRKYEIPYLCNSSLNKECQIPVSDLLVSVRSGKILLRSHKLDKQVVPRMTTAHNYNLTTLPVYQFLCDIQNQGIHLPGWDWGILSDRPFLPGVRYGRFILSRARWVLTKKEMNVCDNRTEEELLANFAEIKEQKKLPDYVRLVQGDNELLLHLQNIYCIRLLLAEVNKDGSAVVTEVMDTPEQCWIRSPDGNHPGEFIVAFGRKKTGSPVSSASAKPERQIRDMKRNFPVGSEWLYAKIYCGTNTGEKILSNVLKPLTEELLSQNLIHKFFFLRFYDEGHHIRIRFNNPRSEDFWKEVISRLRKALQPYMNNRTVYNLQFETYQREVERYGFDTMELSERLFWHHSEAVLNFVSLLDGDPGEQYRWQVGIKAIDIFLDDFYYSLEQKRNLISDLNKSYSEEFKIGHPERKIISERFSDHKRVVDVLLGDSWEENETLVNAIEIFMIRTDDYRRTVEGILKAPSVENNMTQLNYLVRSYLHMFINRLFVSNQRKTELIIYEYLLRYYESKLAREKKGLVNQFEISIAGKAETAGS